MSKGKFYLTTPAYYVNDVPHIGHAYCTIASDVLARFKRMEGYEVFFVTGMDEHGNKIAQSAEERGKKPKEWADTVVERFREAWRALDISYDLMIRTTDNYHGAGVQKIFEAIKDNGYIYLGDYEGWYCVPDEAFWTEKQLVEGNCPDCGRQVERVKEESYFFKLSAFEKKLLELIESKPEFIEPENRWETVSSGRIIQAPCVFRSGERLMVSGRYCSQSDKRFMELRDDTSTFCRGTPEEVAKVDPARVEEYHHGLRTGVFVMDGTRPRLVMELLSAGDSSYVGVVQYGDEFVISDYSMHEYYPEIQRPGDWETPCDIYLSRIRFE